MSRMKLSLATLKDFDFGKADVVVQQAMSVAVRDVLDRPGEKKPRVVTIKVSITPVVQQDGDVVDAEVEFEVANAIPKWRTAPRPVLVGRQGDLFFSPDAPDNPRQETFNMGGSGDDEE